ncbi:MAG TPA: hypothetical protein DD000_10725, partial [Cyanobacteria bacterium UBA11166]|nr:hypothetical protein [Cyanobacteria bacterium UBA11166]
MLIPNKIIRYCCLGLLSFFLILGWKALPSYSQLSSSTPSHTIPTISPIKPPRTSANSSALKINTSNNNNNAPTILPLITQNITDLEAEARQLYETGKLEQAVKLLKEGLTASSNRGDKISQVRIQRNLALVYHKQGNLTLGNEAIAASLNILNNEKNLGNTQEVTRLLAQTLEVQGELQLASGNGEAALETWKKTTENYQKIADITGITRSKINQSQALQTMGLYRQAIRTLTEVGNTLKAQPDSLVKAKGFQSLG